MLLRRQASPEANQCAYRFVGCASNPPSGGADALYASSALAGKNCSYTQDTKLGLEVKNYFVFCSRRRNVVYNIDRSARRAFI